MNCFQKRKTSMSRLLLRQVWSWHPFSFQSFYSTFYVNFSLCIYSFILINSTKNLLIVFVFNVLLNKGIHKGWLKLNNWNGKKITKRLNFLVCFAKTDAQAGNRTRASCLGSINSNHWTTCAFQSIWEDSARYILLMKNFLLSNDTDK